MKHTVAAAILGAIAACPAHAEPSAHPVVLELFTSQGCSSCPPADALVAQLSARPDVLVLSYHVDYWNYLGWRDTFSSPQATERQKSYAKAMGQRMVYTPQLVVNGASAMIGSDEAAVRKAIDEAEAAAEPSPGELSLRAESGEALASAQMADDAPGVLVLVIYGASTEVDVSQGENAGDTLITTNPVLEWMTLGRVGAQEKNWRTPIPNGATGVAALMHGENGAIVASARVETQPR